MCLTSNYHVSYIQLSCVLHPIIMCLASNYHVSYIQLSCVLHLIIMCLTSNYHVSYIQLSCVLHPIIMCLTSNYHVSYIQLSCVLHPIIMCLTSNYHVSYIQLSCFLHPIIMCLLPNYNVSLSNQTKVMNIARGEEFSYASHLTRVRKLWAPQGAADFLHDVDSRHDKLCILLTITMFVYSYFIVLFLIESVSSDEHVTLAIIGSFRCYLYSHWLCPKN